MTEYKALLFSLTLLFIIGIVVPFSVSSFVETSSPSDDSILYGIIVSFNDFVLNGIPIGNFLFMFPSFITDLVDFSFDPFSILGQDFQNFVVTQTIAFTYIPNWLSIPLLIIVFVTFLVGIISLVPTT